MSKLHKDAKQRNPEVVRNRCDNAGEDKNGAAKKGEQQQLSEEERLEQELSWCVEQLELGLETQQPDSRQAMEAMKILRILTNPKAPLVKKRQAMRNTFGDYRSKMKVQEQKSAASVRKAKMASGSNLSTLKSQFVRRSLQSVTRDKDSISETKVFLEKNPKNTDKDSADSDQGGTSNSNQVNAEILDSDKVSSGDSNSISTKMLDIKTSKKEFRFGIDVMDEDGHNIGPITGTDNPGHECTVTDFFKFKKSDNSFRFGFSLHDGDA